jgi:UDP-glucose 4-epimerase
VSYRDKSVLITGGLGFIGSNLAIRLAHEGARVVIVDPAVPGCGGNPFNIEPVRERVQLIPVDIAETAALVEAIRASDVIFNLAGEISHIHSMQYPERDLAINTLSQMRFLMACREHAPGVRIVFAGTRQIYGVPEYLPVDESHPVNPVDFNGVHKYAATMYHLMLSRSGELDAVVLRLTNVYGPRLALDVPCQGFISTFLRRALCGRRLEVFGDGRQLRDPLYVDDAVEALLTAGAARRLPLRAYNVGGPGGLTLLDIATIISIAAGVEPPILAPFPEDRKPIDIGSYYTDSRRIGEDLGWRASTAFEDGIRTTLDFYARHAGHYFDATQADPPCKIAHGDEIRRKMVFAAV